MADSNFHIPHSRRTSHVARPGAVRHPRQPVADNIKALQANFSSFAPLNRSKFVFPEEIAPKRPLVSRPLYRAIGKRLLDIAFVVLLAPIALMMIGLSALALWFEGGNPFYQQDRLGRDGTRFRILKLRTMVRNAETMLEECLANDPALREEWDTTQKLKEDPRITRIGGLLRKTSLDELPQLWNVLIGDMSVVGPRPMLPEQLSLYGNASHYFALRPGITGSWQVSQRNEDAFTQRAVLDRTYDTSLSVTKDVMILLRTVGVVLRRTGY